MSQRSFYGVLFLSVVNFLAILAMLPLFGRITYITEVFALLVFLTLTVFLLGSMGTKRGWVVGIFTFSLNLVNAVYLFLYVGGILLLIYAASSLIGFVLSIYSFNGMCVVKKILKKKSVVNKTIKKEGVKQSSKRVTKKTAKKVAKIKTIKNKKVRKTKK